MNLEKNRKISILIPDGESHLLVYVINCFSNFGQIEIYVLSSLRRNPMRFSKYVKKYIYYPQTEDDQDWIEIINREAVQNTIDLIVPIFEKGIKRILENKQHLSPTVKLVSLPDLDTFNTTINKWNLAVHCNEHQISIPASILYSPNDFFNKTYLENIKFPVITKPLEGFGGGMEIRIFKNEHSLLLYLKERCPFPVIIQQFIEGFDIDCSILAINGEVLAYTIQKGFLPGSNSFKPHVGVEFLEDKKLLELIKKLAKSLNWNGIAHIDCRYDQKEDDYKIIEINPRVWVTIDGSFLMGINFPLLWIQSSLKKKLESSTYRQEKYLNLKGVVKKVKTNPSILINWKFLLKNTQFRFVIYDPLPTIYKFYDRTRNIVTKKFNG